VRLRLGLGAWAVLVSAGLALGFGVLFATDQRTVFLPGRTSDGHHVMEAACGSCHVAFASVPNQRCAACHRAELAEDVHPIKLFDDPRWVATLAKIDALRCVTCHREHAVAPRGVTVAREFCFPCHDDVVGKLSTHRALKPDSCGNAGCHNYHDNTALNTAFLKKRMGEPELTPVPALLVWGSAPKAGTVPAAANHPPELTAPAALVEDWRSSIHAVSDVNCMDCHKGPAGPARTPGPKSCERCHRFEVESFHAGKHGVRYTLDQPPLAPAMARRPMKPDARASLSCAVCHDPHRLDTRRAATEACLACHDDPHSTSFKHSKHFATPAQEDGGGRVGPRAVTCATCHLPRTKVEGDEGTRVAVNHNNSFTLWPRDRMVKEVCLACHGLEFALTSILDDALVTSNFQGRPRGRHESFKMVEEVLAEERRRAVEGGGRK
jgi:predicted CXXCH cytochrome family protein